MTTHLMSRSFFSRIEVASSEELRSLQNTKLRNQMIYLEGASPFYREKLRQAGASFDDIQSVDDLASLPFTTKEELRRSQQSYPPYGSHVAAPRRDIVRVHASSGTTGTPSFIPVTAHDSALWREAIKRAFWCQGVRPESVVAMGFSIGFFVGGIPLAQGIEEIGATFLPVGTGATERLLEVITSMQADGLACTPSYALYLAETARDRMSIDVAELGVRRLMVGAEPGGGEPHTRRQIEELWNATVTEAVGNADVIPIHSAESDLQGGCHFLVPDMMVMEIVDPDTGHVQSLDSGELEGEMVFTHIDRQAVPLLRFRTGDRVLAKTGPCANGRTGPRIRVIGRTDDLLILRGVNVWPSAVRDVIAGFRPATTGAVRILLPSPGPTADPPLHIRVEHGEGRDISGLDRILEHALKEKLVFSARIELVPPGTLPRSEMKAKLVQVEERR